MSYYQVEPSYYVNDKNLYGPGGDARVPVPGWGLLPHVAGPDRIAVGATDTRSAAEKVAAWGKSFASGSKMTDAAVQKCMEGGNTLAQCTDTVQSQSKGVPWWVYIAVPAGIGTLLAVGSYVYSRSKKP